MTKSIISKFALTGAASITAMAISIAAAQAQAMEFDIEAQPLSSALLEFNEQAGVIVMVSGDLVDGKTSPAVKGSMEPEDALDKILTGSGLKAADAPNGAYTITLASASLGERSNEARLLRMAQVDQANDSVTLVQENESTEDNEQERDTIIVTGTNIRGIAPDSSPTRVFDRNDILNSGVGTIDDFLQLLPENFGGGANPDIPFGLADDSSSRGNSTFGSSVNLRGLGAGSTLTLLNGRRIAPTSNNGGFVDVSMIPVSAIERVEILSDGASSIYGADAVAGVVNFVLRDDYEGLEASTRYGTVTTGDREEFRGSVTGGLTWKSGNAVASYEYLNQTDLGAEDRDFASNAMLPFDLLPSQERNSVVVAGSQDITRNVSLDLDLLFSRRETVLDTTRGDGRLTQQNASSEGFSIGGGLTWDIEENWDVRFSTVYSNIANDIQTIDPTFGDAAFGVDSNIWAADLISSGRILSVNGNDVSIAVGGHLRFEELTDDSEIIDRDVIAAFGEIYIPIISPDNGVRGINRLDINASVRHSDFSDFGVTTNPKVGLLWEPIDGVKLRGTYSTSFKPPALGRIGNSFNTGSLLPTALINSFFGFTPGDPSIADTTVLSLSGTDPSLDPETSRAFTAGVEIDQTFSKNNVRLTANFYDINFKGRLNQTPVPQGRSALDAWNLAFNSPELFPAGIIVFNPSTAEIEEALANLDLPVSNLFGVDPATISIISRLNVLTNISETQSQGIDVGVHYGREIGSGTLSAGLNGTYIIKFTEQASVGTPVVDEVSTLFNPVDFRARGSVGYASEVLAANLFFNYVNDYRVDLTPGSDRIDDWFTVDLNFRYQLGSSSRTDFFRNLSLQVSVQNLFDSPPPSTPGDPTFLIAAYDPTNASPLERFVSIQLTKSW